MRTLGPGCALMLLLALPAQAAQEQLVPFTDIAGPVLRFEWPAIEIGVGSYEEGPTGLTVFRFPKRASAVVDVRGGSPGTVNTDALRLGYGSSFVDAIVFAGGSSYGEEAIGAVLTGLKEQGSRTGNWDDVAFVSGAVLYDFVGHRLTELYPDKRLAQATLQALRPGAFPLGAQGAGRMAMQGSFFGCGAHAGQGAAFRHDGELKIAAFVVVNATGSVVKRDGSLLRCAPNADGSNAGTIAELLARVGSNARPDRAPPAPTRATTLSLIVTNRQMGYPALQRLAVQLHGSMGRAIQPFSTQEDGDTLFAVSTQELAPAASPLSLMQIDVIASELMWDAILASGPEQPTAAMPQTVAVAPERLARLAGRYRFGPQALIEVAVAEGRLIARMGAPGFFDLRPGQPVSLMPRSETEFGIEGRHGMQLVFTLGTDGRGATALLNPGRWEQRGERLPD